MRLVFVLCMLIGAVTVFADGRAAAAAHREHAAPEALPSLAAEMPGAASAPLDPARKPPRTIESPSTFAMGMLTLLALAEMFRRRRRFIAENAAL
jgi:hypothetical protein